MWTISAVQKYKLNQEILCSPDFWSFFLCFGILRLFKIATERLQLDCITDYTIVHLRFVNTRKIFFTQVQKVLILLLSPQRTLSHLPLPAHPTFWIVNNSEIYLEEPACMISGKPRAQSVAPKARLCYATLPCARTAPRQNRGKLRDSWRAGKRSCAVLLN